ncbi:MAG: tRNA (guanosine(37)-N1)-methyltransferase TrmD [Candidatus Saccharibacteria bacterium]|jgi:tRNA (guanine37-N1)-methyltransferase
MKIDIITLFPEVFEQMLDHSMLHKAREAGAVEFRVVNLRDFGIGPRQQVDDTPYGGGAGMLLKPEPMFAAVEQCKLSNPAAKVLMMTPRGKRYAQVDAKRLARESGLIILCGHYEGFDERILSIVDEEISLGDFVMTGGEIPAMAIADSVVRLLPGVLGDARSSEDESFSQGLLEYAHYTRPQEFRGMTVPEELLGGNHAKIRDWRRQSSIEKTAENRPDLTEF